MCSTTISTLLVLSLSIGSAGASQRQQQFLAPDYPLHEATLTQYEEVALIAKVVTLSYILAVIKRLLIWLIFLVFCIVMYTCFYKPGLPGTTETSNILERLTWLQTKSDSDEKVTAEAIFKTGHFHCLEDVGTCIPAFLCMPIRWSDTLSVSWCLGFWFSFVLWEIAAAANCFTYGLPFFGLFTCVLMLILRQNVRAKLRLPRWGPCTLFYDCCFVCWCPCCAVAQEARAMNEAYKNKEPPFEAGAS